MGVCCGEMLPVNVVLHGVGQYTSAKLLCSISISCLCYYYSRSHMALLRGPEAAI